MIGVLSGSWPRRFGYLQTSVDRSNHKAFSTVMSQSMDSQSWFDWQSPFLYFIIKSCIVNFTNQEIQEVDFYVLICPICIHVNFWIINLLISFALLSCDQLIG